MMKCNKKQFSYLSFDCANRSLGYSHVTFNIEIFERISKLIFELEKFSDKMIPEILSLLLQIDEEINLFMIIHLASVADILGAKIKDVGSIDRVRCLYKFLNSLVVDGEIEPGILIEKQPEIKNFKSSSVSDQLCMYFADHSEIFLVSPKLKNNLSFGNDLTYEIFYEKYLKKMIDRRDEKISKKDLEKVRYTANKEHSIANFKYVTELFGYDFLVGIKKTNYDDIADSFMQILAFIRDKQ